MRHESMSFNFAENERINVLTKEKVADCLCFLSDGEEGGVGRGVHEE